MKIIGLNEQFGDYEKANIPADFDWFVYDYEYGSYEGSGYAVGKLNGKYYHFYCGHCSCNGPMEGATLGQGYDSYEELLKKCSMELVEGMQKITAWIKKNDGTPKS